MVQPRINTNQIQTILSEKVKIDEFSTLKEYIAGVLIQKDNYIYLSKVNITPGAFDESQWLKIANTSDISKLKEELDKKVEEVEGIGNISTTRTDNKVIINQTTFIYEQGISADTWEINHNLNRFPSVTVIDTTGQEVDGEITYVDTNNCIIKMNAPFKGKAYLN